MYSGKYFCVFLAGVSVASELEQLLIMKILAIPRGNLCIRL